MSYTQAVFSAFALLCAFASLVFLPFPIFALIGAFAGKRYPETEKRLRYGVVISARNEEAVIGDLIDSIRANRYPQELITVFVMAHNCTDQTERVSREAGAVVYRYDNPKEARVGYAYRRLFQYIQRDYGPDAFDGFLVLDADNLLSPDYLVRMNEAFVAEGQTAVVTSFRNAKNFSQNYLSTLYGLLFVTACRLESRGRAVCGCSTRVMGTGYLFPSELVRDGWTYTTLTEDWELSADLISQGGRILYCDEAEFFDEQPTKLSIMLRQRLRWARGHMDVFSSKVAQTVLSLRHKGARFSKYDIALQIMPLGVITIGLNLLQLFALGLCPLFGEEAGAALRQWWSTFANGIGTAYLSIFLSGLLVLWLERGRIHGLRPLPTALALALWPLFLTLAIPLDMASLFVKGLEWKPIPHSYYQSKEVTDSEISSPH